MLSINYQFDSPFSISDTDPSLIVDANGTPILRAENQMLAYGFVTFINSMLETTETQDVTFEFAIDSELNFEDMAEDVEILEIA